MDNGIANITLIKQLLHEKNTILVKLISDLTIKSKRHIFNIIRLHTPQHSNHLLLQFSACTLGEFCVTQVLLNDSKRKFKDYLEKQ
jgi:hypothetical protein